MGKSRFLMILIAACGLTACSATVEAPPSKIGAVHYGGARTETSTGTGALSGHENFEAEMAIEDQVSKGCVDAWRKGLKGDKKGALSDLDELAKRYPNLATISFMRGQILDHLGDKKEAIEFYRQAITNNEFSTLRIFKLAEALRATNQNKEAAIEYRRLLKSAPDFVPGKVGLAKSLLATDKSSAEARQQLQSALKIDQRNKDAKAVLESLEGKN